MKDRKADKNIVGAMVVGLYETIVNSNWENGTDDKNDNMEMEQYNKIAEASYRLADAAEEALVDVRSMEEKASGVSIEDISLISDSLKENGEKKLKKAIKHVKDLDKDVLEVKDHTVILQREMKRATKAANDAGGAVAGIVSKLLEARVGITRSIENLGIAADSDEAYRKFSTALANATGAYSHASDGKEIYDEALLLYEKAGKAGERAKKGLDDAFEKLSFDASSACADIVSVKNNLDRLRTALKKNLESARREKERTIKDSDDGIVKLDDGVRYRLSDEVEEVFVSLNDTVRHVEGEVTDLSNVSESVEYNLDDGIYKKHKYGTVTSVAFLGATLSGKDDGFSNIGQAINSAAKSCTEQASHLDVNDDVKDINIDYTCTVKTSDSLIRVYTESISAEQIEEMKKDSITQKDGMDVVILMTDKETSTVTYALTESVQSDSKKLGIDVIFSSEDDGDIDWNVTGQNVLDAINKKADLANGIIVNSSLKLSPKSRGVLGISYLYIPTFSISVTETKDIEIGTKFSDEKAVEKIALEALEEKSKKLLEEEKKKYPEHDLSFQSVGIDTEVSVAYRYDIYYNKYVMLDTEDVLISTKTYRLVPATESIYKPDVVANMLEMDEKTDGLLATMNDLEKMASEICELVEDASNELKKEFTTVKFNEVLDKASTNLGVANSLLDSINYKLTDAKKN
ncbi:MAG: hypothetical protein K6F37_03125, partial [Lachnospiraceae bacterium]|nr:hypothetical protein [Lachnospiraceae bacterium]